MQSRIVVHRTTKDIKRVGKSMRKSGKSWDEISADLGIFTADGRLNSGLAYKIIEQDYEPARSETRYRLGLVPCCPNCKRKLSRGVRKKDLFSTPEKELRKMLEHRAEM